MIRIANTIDDSIVDGPGLRYTIFTQGCVHNCIGCHNPETHNIGGGSLVSLEELASKIGINPLTAGITLSGGEPFLQAKECAYLAKVAKNKGLSVWVYSGYTYEYISAKDNEAWTELLSYTDVLVDGPYVQFLKSYDALFRGSTNQRLIDVPKTVAKGEIVIWSREDSLSKFVVPKS